ncbi:MAG TPA: hypothetical protein VF045_07990, partial [Acidimicrobiales bacterium]
MSPVSAGGAEVGLAGEHRASRFSGARRRLAEAANDFRRHLERSESSSYGIRRPPPFQPLLLAVRWVALAVG